MTGKDILIELGALDPRIVMRYDQSEMTAGRKSFSSSGTLRKLVAIAAAIVLIIGSFAFISNLMDKGFVTDDYADVMISCDTAVLAQYKGKTEKLTYTEYAFEVTEVLQGELTDTEITVRSKKDHFFADDDMEKFSESVSAEFKEGAEYFLTLAESKNGNLSFFVEQIISIDAIGEASSRMGDFLVFLEKNGITIDVTRDELIRFLKYIFGKESPEEECTHQFGEAIVTEYPTDTTPGLQTRICEICSLHKAEEIFASEGLEYSFDDKTKTGKVVSCGKCKDTDIYVPKYVDGYLITNIYAFAFKYDNDNHRSIKSILLPDSITTIEYRAFYNCTELKSIRIPASVTTIDVTAFNGCKALEKISVEPGNSYYKSIGNCLIDIQNKKLIIGCGNSVIPADGSVIMIGDYAFYGTNLKNITIPEEVTMIGDKAFSGCSSLESIVIPSSVVSIGDSAFSYCTSIKSVVIPDSVTKIGKYAFEGTNITYAVLPDGLSTIPTGLFSDCRMLSKLVVPDSVISVEERAFYGCCNLSDAGFLKRVTSIGDYAFFNCASIQEITFSNKLTKLGKSSFSACNKITSIVIPSSVNTISESAFENCYALANLTIQNGVRYLENRVFFNCLNIGRVTLPGSVESIGESAFSGCRNMTNITIPNSVTYIGSYAFLECYKLSSITLPNNLKSIGQWTFFDCRTLKNITIPATVTSIGECAFAYCKALINVTIRGKLTEIGANCFSQCENLERINYSGTQAEWKAVIKGEEWDYSSGYYNVSCTDGMIEKK